MELRAKIAFFMLSVLLVGCKQSPVSLMRKYGCTEVSPGIFRCNKQIIADLPELEKYRIRGETPREYCNDGI